MKPIRSRGARALTVMTVLLCGAGAASAAAATSGESSQTWSFHSAPALTPMRVKIDVSRPGQAPGLVFVAPFSSGTGPLVGTAGPLILDTHGNPVWVHPVPSGQEAADFKVQTLRGKPVLTWWQGIIAVPPKYLNLPAGTPEPGAKFFVYDQHYRRIATLTGRNGWIPDLHELLITPQGTALFEVAKTLTADLSAYGGSKTGQVEDFGIQEVDLKTGRSVSFWDMLKHVPLSQSQVKVPPKGIWDPFHMNSVDLDRSGHLLISARNTWAIYEVSRKSGKILWQLGGKGETIKPSAGAFFDWQHDARFHPSGEISLFDDACCNLPGGAPSHYSRGLLLKLNLKRHTATVAAQFGHQPPLYVPSQGNAELLPGGGAFVGWGQAPYYSELTRSGKLIYDVKMPGGDESYRSLLESWSATPYYSPRVAVGGTSARPVLYTSWNGATAVSAWEVLAGPGPKHLKVLVRRARRTGFETTIRLRGAHSYYQVRALDRGGRVLGSAGVSSR